MKQHSSFYLCLFCCQHTDGEVILQLIEVPTAVKALRLCFGGAVKKSGPWCSRVWDAEAGSALDPRKERFQWDPAECGPVRK